MKVAPITLPAANGYVTLWHRHHAPIPAGFVWWSVAAIDEDGTVHGVAIAGRPTNRNNDDGLTVEVLRVATNGRRNAPSILLGACARAAKAIGARRCITYTLEEETGASLRGAGWTLEADGITSSWMKGTSRRTAVPRDHMERRKARWAVHFGGASDVPASSPDLTSDSQPSLFAELGEA